ncbi:hypothetical protein [Massilia consociata]|uniref:Uncharacterized protein n=1 Tax=Massilia consociata TaxID=760117 RepID=A0ABV6FI86_9BURK
MARSFFAERKFIAGKPKNGKFIVQFAVRGVFALFQYMQDQFKQIQKLA